MDVPKEPAVRYDSALMDTEHLGSPNEVRSAEDSALVEWAQAGNAPAFEELVRRYRNEVFALSYHFVRQRDTAWDLSQEVFIKAYRSLRWFRGDAGFKTWLMRIAANQCKDHLKKRRLKTASLDERLRTEAPSSIERPDAALEARELGEAIERAVAALLPKHQVAFVLREYEGLSYDEMARVMQCSPGTVMSRLHHARKKLQHALVSMGVMEGP